VRRATEWGTRTFIDAHLDRCSHSLTHRHSPPSLGAVNALTAIAATSAVTTTPHTPMTIASTRASSDAHRAQLVLGEKRMSVRSPVKACSRPRRALLIEGDTVVPSDKRW